MHIHVLGLFKTVYVIENATMAMYSHAYPWTGYLVQINSFQTRDSSRLLLSAECQALGPLVKENLYAMYFSHTVSCMTSDDILWYVGVF
jgi:hypothetical protein